MKSQRNKWIMMGILVLNLGWVQNSFGFSSSKNSELGPNTKNQPLVNTNMDEVFGKEVTDGTAKVWLRSGLYEMGELAGKSSDRFLLVEKDVNDDSKVLAILFDKSAVNGYGSHSGSMYLYQGRPIEENRKLMLAPVAIDDNGNIDITTLRNDQAPVVIISKVGRDGYWAYTAKGVNGAFSNAHFGIRRSSNSTPILRARPTSGMFVAADSCKKADLLIEETELSINEGSSYDGTYTMISSNQAEGQFSAIVKSKFNATRESSSSKEVVEGFSIFVSGCFDREVMLLAKPVSEELGKYRLRIFKLAKRDIVDFFFPGRE